MNRFLMFLTCIALFSCDKKEVALPQISGINLLTQMNDYSVIYIFYDEKTQQSELNTNNLISSTHWVFNIDKRLSLSEVGKNVAQLQEKKAKPNLHSNPDSRNFFSVADMQVQQLKFLEFTKTRFFVSYQEDETNLVNIENPNGFIAQIKEKHVNSVETISVKGDVSFQDFLVFLQKIQEEGIFIKRIIILSEKLP